MTTNFSPAGAAEQACGAPKRKFGLRHHFSKRKTEAQRTRAAVNLNLLKAANKLIASLQPQARYVGTLDDRGNACSDPPPGTAEGDSGPFAPREPSRYAGQHPSAIRPPTSNVVF